MNLLQSVPMNSYYNIAKKKFIPLLRPTTSCSYDGSCSAQSLKCSLLEFLLFWLKLKVQLELFLRIAFENLRFLIWNQSQKRREIIWSVLILSRIAGLWWLSWLYSRKVLGEASQYHKSWRRFTWFVIKMRYLHFCH